MATKAGHEPPKTRGPIAHAIRLLAIPIVLAWVAIAVAVNTLAPKLAVVSEQHSATMVPKDAPSVLAMTRMGKNFREFDTNSTVMIVLEGQKQLGDDAHRYYDDIVGKLQQDSQNVQYVQNFLGQSLTAAGAQSSDAKAAYVEQEPELVPAGEN